MLSRTLGVMFKVKQLFNKTCTGIFLLYITLFLVHFNNFEVIRSQNLKVSKSNQNNEVTSITYLLGVPYSFLLHYEKHRAIFKISATLFHQPNLTLTTARNIHAFYSCSYSENVV